MEFPTLYTRASTGKVQSWRPPALRALRAWKIAVVCEGPAVFIRREYGQEGGKAARSRPSLYEQAAFEAQSDWVDKGQRRGCAEAKAPAPRGPGDQPGAAGGSCPAPAVGPAEECAVLPMLAQNFDEYKRHLCYPCIGQPKIDGIRFTARRVGATVFLWTRAGKERSFFGEIKAAILALDLSPQVVLDGEFYSRRVPFKTLNGYCNVSLLRSYAAIPPEDLASIHYHVFDCYFLTDPQRPFAERYAYLQRLFGGNHSPYLELVPNFAVAEEGEVAALHDRLVAEGYEGLILRNSSAPYRLKNRTSDLLKLKHFKDSEFEIVGASCGEGREEGCVIWTLRVPGTDRTFACRPRDTLEERKKDWAAFLRKPADFVGKLYTVRYQETIDGVPRFGSGIALRGDLS